LRAHIPHVLSHPVQLKSGSPILLTKSQKTAKNCKKIATYFYEILLRRDLQTHLLGGSCGALPKYEACHNSHAAFRAEVNFVITEILQLVKNIFVAISCDFFCYFVAILLRFSQLYQMAEYSGIHTIPHVFWITCTAM
jgi:hypothetical protein